MLLSPLCAARAAAEHTKAGAVRMVERHAAIRFPQGSAELELRIIGKQGAGHHRRVRCPFALYDHSRRGAHHRVGRDPEDIPTRRRDLRDILGRIHLGEEDELHGVVRIERQPMLAEQPRVAGPQCGIGFARKPPSGDVNDETVVDEPVEAGKGRASAPRTALELVQRPAVVIE